MTKLRRLFAPLAVGVALASAVPSVLEKTAWAEGGKTYVRPEDLAAARAAQEKSAAARKLIKAGKVSEGLPMLDEAVGEMERTIGPDVEAVKANRDLVVMFYRETKQPAKAQAALDRAERYRKAPKAPPKPANAHTASAMEKLQLGLTALKAGDVLKAAEYLEQAMPEVAKSDASETQYLLISGVLASLYDYSQQFAKGESLRKEVIARLEKKLGPDAAEVGDQYDALATHYAVRVDTTKAIAAGTRALEIGRVRAPNSAIVSDRLLFLAQMHMNTASWDIGRAQLLEAMTIARTLSPPDPVRLVRTAHTLVMLSDGALKPDEGDRAADMTCALARTANEPAVLEEAEPDCIRAALAKNDTKTAGALSAARLARTQKKYGTASDFYAHAAHDLARVRWVEGKKEEATSLAQQAAEAKERYIARVLSTSGDTLKRAQLKLLDAQSYDLIAMGGSGDGSGGLPQVRLALETILRRKGRSLDASADAARLVRLFDKPADKQLAARQVEVRRQIAALGLRGQGGGGSSMLDPAALMAKLQAEDDEIGNKLAAASPVYRAESKPITISDVQAALPDDSVLVEYVYYHQRETTKARFFPQAPRFVAYVLHKSGDPIAVDLGDAMTIVRSVDGLRKSLSERGDVLPHAKRLHGLVVGPIQRHLRPTDKRLVVSPDDDLNLVPYGALVTEKGDFLVKDYEIAYVTSGRDLLRIQAANAQPRSNAKPVVVGDPAFDGAGSAPSAAAETAAGSRAGDLDNARFPALPGTAVEAKTIAEMLGAVSYTQAAATKSALVSTSSPVILHVATHGFFLTKERETPQTSVRGLEYEPGAEVITPPRSENPLIRSGLALAGANRKNSAEGLITALEASSMNLEGTRLVVLSACETGVGQTETGDGVYGLRRALVVAGSSSQLMSLWKVDDDATRDLMVAFYRDLKAGSGRAAALRKVQLAMLATPATRHPYFWAAFIPSGAWGPMSFDVQSAPAAARPVKDKPKTSDGTPPSRDEENFGTMARFGLHYLTATNLRDQADRAGMLVGFSLEHPILARYLSGETFALHDAVAVTGYAGLRTSDATKYANGEEEGGLGYGFRGGYEAALGLRHEGFGAYVGGQWSYDTFALGDVRSYGHVLPLLALVNLRLGDTLVGVRGTYGKWIVDQEVAGLSLSTSFGDDWYLRAGVEELKLPTTVSLDGLDLRAGAQRQVTTIASLSIGGHL